MNVSYDTQRKMWNIYTHIVKCLVEREGIGKKEGEGGWKGFELNGEGQRKTKRTQTRNPEASPRSLLRPDKMNNVNVYQKKKKLQGYIFFIRWHD